MMNKRKTILLIKTLIFFGVLTLLFITSSYFYPWGIALLSAITSTVLFFALIELNERWLFPVFYKRNRKRKFFILNFVSVIIFALTDMLCDGLLFHPHILFTISIKIPIYFPIIRSISMFFLVDFISISILLSDVLRTQAITEKQLKEEKLGTEIKLLKAQINPHFIFNALNNIYSLSYSKSDVAPESILKLSEMLRYVFYDCSEDDVKLKAEIDYIENYISFQQMKSEHSQHIKFEHEKLNTQLKIAPMLFIPLIENSFKYSKIEEFKDAYVNMALSNNEKTISFSIKNSIPAEGKVLSGSGLGINNVKQRLEMLYPKKHKLEITDTENTFIINLTIDLS